MIKIVDGFKSNLRNLTVYNTQITTDNMILLLENIEVSNMTNLNLGIFLLKQLKIRFSIQKVSKFHLTTLFTNFCQSATSLLFKGCAWLDLIWTKNNYNI